MVSEGERDIYDHGCNSADTSDRPLILGVRSQWGNGSGAIRCEACWQ